MAPRVGTDGRTVPSYICCILISGGTRWFAVRSRRVVVTAGELEIAFGWILGMLCAHRGWRQDRITRLVSPNNVEVDLVSRHELYIRHFCATPEESWATVVIARFQTFAPSTSVVEKMTRTRWWRCRERTLCHLCRASRWFEDGATFWNFSFYFLLCSFIFSLLFDECVYAFFCDTDIKGTLGLVVDSW